MQMMFTKIMILALVMTQTDPDAISAGALDEKENAKIDRKRKREESFKRFRETERRKEEDRSRVVSWNEVDKNQIDGDFDSEEECDESGQPEYLPPTHGHRRKRQKIIHLAVDVEHLRNTHSAIGDRRKNTSRGRSDTLTNFVRVGAGNLYDVPCSPRTMIE